MRVFFAHQRRRRGAYTRFIIANACPNSPRLSSSGNNLRAKDTRGNKLDTSAQLLRSRPQHAARARLRVRFVRSARGGRRVCVVRVCLLNRSPGVLGQLVNRCVRVRCAEYYWTWTRCVSAFTCVCVRACVACLCANVFFLHEGTLRLWAAAAARGLMNQCSELCTTQRTRAQVQVASFNLFVPLRAVRGFSHTVAVWR